MSCLTLIFFGGTAFDGFEVLRFSMVGSEFLPLLVIRVYSWINHLYKGRKVGMQAAATPNKTSHVRQYQLGILSPCCNRQQKHPAGRKGFPTSGIIGHVLIVEDCPNQR